SACIAPSPVHPLSLHALFRSQRGECDIACPCHSADEDRMNRIDNSQRVAAKVAGVSGLLAVVIVVFGNYALLGPLIVPGNAAETDRKSTRLNSSHQVNSYAVF